MTAPNITIGETGPDWEPTTKTRYFAQRGETAPFGFGATEAEALADLLREEAKNVAASRYTFYPELNDACQYSTVYDGDKPIGSVTRRRVLEVGPAWVLCNLQGTRFGNLAVTPRKAYSPGCGNGPNDPDYDRLAERIARKFATMLDRETNG